MHARAERVRVADVGIDCFWLDGSGACTLFSCEAARAKQHGYHIDAMRPCTLDGCVARACGDAGVVLDFPKTLLRAHGVATTPAAQLQTPHSAKARTPLRCGPLTLKPRHTFHTQHVHAPVTVTMTRTIAHARAQHIECVENGSFGVLLRGGVGADLRGAVLERNGWNGLRVEHATMPLLLRGASISHNGHDDDASDKELETHGMVIEKPFSAHVEPPLGPPPAVPQGVTMRGNKGGAWAFWERH